MPKRISSIEVLCKCGEKLFMYRKSGTGRLIKCALDQITDVRTIGVLGAKNNTEIFCPICSKRIGTIQMHSGKPALKLNQGQIEPVYIS